jgi:glyoxylase-like metal-dependent hydrolase (beta-lactamase superfamily II)
MKSALMTAAAIAALGLSVAAAAAGERTVDRLYILQCGEVHAPDQSRWSPGVNVGKPIVNSDNCYLIRHGKDWLLWDTGYNDDYAGKPDGTKSGDSVVFRKESLAAELAALHLKPAEIRYVAISHMHPDHTGNVDLFPTSTIVMQRVEYDAIEALPKPPFTGQHSVLTLAGDWDVFGDGSVTILSTPGHTAGHESLLVRLKKTGNVVLSGDAVHFKDNWDNRRVPSMNVDKDKTLASMQRLADVMAQNHAQLWINHDKVQSDAQRHAPQFYD